VYKLKDWETIRRYFSLNAQALVGEGGIMDCGLRLPACLPACGWQAGIAD